MDAQATQPKVSRARDKPSRTHRLAPQKASPSKNAKAKDNSKAKPKANARSAHASLATAPAVSTGLSAPAVSVSAGPPSVQDWGQKLKSGAAEALKHITGSISDAAQKVQSLFGPNAAKEDVTAAPPSVAVRSPLLAIPSSPLGASLGNSSETNMGRPHAGAHLWMVRGTTESSSTMEEEDADQVSWSSHETQPVTLGALSMDEMEVTNVSLKSKKTVLPWETLIGSWDGPVYVLNKHGPHHATMFTPNRWRQLVKGYNHEPDVHGLPPLAATLRLMGDSVLVPQDNGWAQYDLDATLAKTFPYAWPTAQSVLAMSAAKSSSDYERHFSDVMKHIVKGVVEDPNELFTHSTWLRIWIDGKLKNIRTAKKPLDESLEEFITGLFWLPKDVSDVDKKRRQALLLALMDHDRGAIARVLNTNEGRARQWVSEQWSLVDKNLSIRPWE
jgi:hypothetical protein